MSQHIMTPPTIGSSPSRRRSRGRWVTAIALGFIMLMVLCAVFAKWIAPYPPNLQDITRIFESPSDQHWLGTDQAGRDVLSRLIYGARVSLLAGLQGVSIAAVVGIPLGILAGYVGGRFAAVVTTVNDCLMAVPGLVLAVAFVAVLGQGVVPAMFAVGLVFIPRFLRVARAMTLSVRNLLFVEGLVSMGAGHGRILWRHMLPNVIGPLIVEFTLVLSACILAEAALSFLGLAAQPPTASWGAMLTTAQGNPSMTHLFYPPGIAIAATVLAITLVGDSLTDRFGKKASR